MKVRKKMELSYLLIYFLPNLYFICLDAFLEKVVIKKSSGLEPSLIILIIFSIIVVVFPEPAPAIIQTADELFK